MAIIPINTGIFHVVVAMARLIMFDNSNYDRLCLFSSNCSFLHNFLSVFGENTKAQLS